MERFSKSFWLVLSALIFVCGTAHAATEAGKILYARGVVSIVDLQESSRGGRSGAKIFEGDRVVTGRGGIAQIRLSDGALIALRGSSEYQIEKQTFGNDEGVYEQAGKLFTGWMRSITGAIGQKYPQKVTQRTSVATIGIRVTVYQVISIPPEGLPGFAGEEPGTYVFLEEGAVQLDGEGGSRLLKPGDVVFMPFAGGAPKLMPGKKMLFLNAADDAIEFVEAEDLDFSAEINDGLAEFLGVSEGPFVSPAISGYVGGSSYSSEGGFALVTSYDIAGSGGGRILKSVAISSGGVEYQYTGNAGASPTDKGFHVFGNSSSVNWGIWRLGDYSVFDAALGSPVTPFDNWHYMMASNVVSDTSFSGLTGQATYNFVGGTPLIDAGTGVTHNISGGAVTVDLGQASMAVTLQSSLGNIVQQCSTCSIGEFYSSGLAVGTGTYNGTMKGSFVAEGKGIISSLDLSGGANEFYRGTAAFETDVAPPIVGAGP